MVDALAIRASCALPALGVLEDEMAELIGNAGKPRIVAMMLDNAIAGITCFAVGAKIPGISGISRGGVMAAVYLAYFPVLEGMWSPRRQRLGDMLAKTVVAKSQWPS